MPDHSAALGKTGLVIVGLVGGLLIALAECHAVRHLSGARRPKWLLQGFYWLVTIAMAAVGGFLVWLHTLDDGVHINAYLALNIGASAPLIVNSLARHLPRLQPGDTD